LQITTGSITNYGWCRHQEGIGSQISGIKGWFDRVLVYGGLYSGRMRYNHGYS